MPFFFIMLPCLVSVLLTFWIQNVLKFKKKSVPKRLISEGELMVKCHNRWRNIDFFNPSQQFNFSWILFLRISIPSTPIERTKPTLAATVNFIKPYNFFFRVRLCSVCRCKSSTQISSAAVLVNLLATDFFFQILAHPVFKMWVIQKPNNVALWNKRHFEGEKMEIIQHVSNIQYGYLLNKYKMGHLEGNFTPVLCMGRKVPKG